MTGRAIDALDQRSGETHADAVARHPLEPVRQSTHSARQTFEQFESEVTVEKHSRPKQVRGDDYRPRRFGRDCTRRHRAAVKHRYLPKCAPRGLNMNQLAASIAFAKDSHPSLKYQNQAYRRVAAPEDDLARAPMLQIRTVREKGDRGTSRITEERVTTEDSGVDHRIISREGNQQAHEEH